MNKEKEKMILGEKYNPADPRLVIDREEQIEYVQNIIKGVLMN